MHILLNNPGISSTKQDIFTFFWTVSAVNTMFLFQIDVLKAGKEFNKRGGDEFLPTKEGTFNNKSPANRLHLSPSGVFTFLHRYVLYGRYW